MGKRKPKRPDKPDKKKRPILDIIKILIGRKDYVAHFHPYPVEIPTQDIFALIVEALRNKQVDMKEAAHGAWHIAGYVLSKWTPPVGGRSAGQPLSATEAADMLEGAMARSSGGEDVAAFEGLPWDLILPILLDLIRKWLGF